MSANIRISNKDSVTVKFEAYLKDNNKFSFRANELLYTLDSSDKELYFSTFNNFVNKFQNLTKDKSYSIGESYKWNNDEYDVALSLMTISMKIITAKTKYTQNGASEYFQKVKDIKPSCYKATDL